jgi:hypothetical protein
MIIGKYDLSFRVKYAVASSSMYFWSYGASAFTIRAISGSYCTNAFHFARSYVNPFDCLDGSRGVTSMTGERSRSFGGGASERGSILRIGCRLSISTGILACMPWPGVFDTCTTFVMMVLRRPITPTIIMIAPIAMNSQPTGIKMMVKHRSSPMNQIMIPIATRAMTHPQFRALKRTLLLFATAN